MAMLNQRLKESLDSFCNHGGAQAEADFDVPLLCGFRKIGRGYEHFEVVNNNTLRMKRRALTHFECQRARVVEDLREGPFTRPLGSTDSEAAVVSPVLR